MKSSGRDLWHVGRLNLRVSEGCEVAELRCSCYGDDAVVINSVWNDKEGAHGMLNSKFELRDFVT